ncbi:aminotransferase class I/II-fold pyridoxal phosphate-dependent enzyme [Nocardiopsis sp. NPDC101807]|uniref:aminotransferase class I/II-fold pyridoxal phosphate-dependent enzyme n=1 Tax=Nocardiopsis sp. NPDC101807 TaxID=3364339 RepID=UPI0037F862BB
MPLAIHSYDALPLLEDGPDVLNLAWTQDERSLLTADVHALISRALEREHREGLPHIGSYMVKDPYGEGELGDAVAAHFGVDRAGISVSCGSGVGPLLHNLTVLAAGATVRFSSDVYPDVPVWVERFRGHRSGSEAPDGTPEAVRELRVIERDRPALVVLERPALTPSRLSDLGELAALCEVGARYGALVVVDESNANYESPDYSAVGLVPAARNLIVVRGLSKAYGLGGLRLGFCVCHPELAPTVRHVVPPLQASSLSLGLAREILGLGDIGGRLRAGVSGSRDRTVGLLGRFGVDGAEPANGHLPYVLVREDARTWFARLRRRGVQGKIHPFWSAGEGGFGHLLRLSVPLSRERRDRFRSLLEAQSP